MHLKLRFTSEGKITKRSIENQSKNELDHRVRRVKRRQSGGSSGGCRSDSSRGSSQTIALLAIPVQLVAVRIPVQSTGSGGSSGCGNKPSTGSCSSSCNRCKPSCNCR
ncbi:uncharacterized protein LOC111632979 isoform X2 [Centruroides sculpturatus]|uniref:uncharacterized protein LOC111632979 isoform X2 n=1 Tax=Centruroides sculpturatus TaxID=218467 RepID=UPI000C6DB06E|nr:uncharacterized protein LOC111632979 isoform X2 [Centruroides sculpturatus]